ncbi:MAG: hypothetical protein ACRCZJ_04925, partial [Erysipelotrichaceae bacterium]
SVYGKENILNRHNLEILEEITYTPEATWLEEGKGMDYMFFYKSGEETLVDYQGKEERGKIQMDEKGHFYLQTKDKQIPLPKKI